MIRSAGGLEESKIISFISELPAKNHNAFNEHTLKQFAKMTKSDAEVTSRTYRYLDGV
jgi:hypothetical protein